MSIQDDEVVKLKYFDWDKAKCFYYVYKLNSINAAAKYINTSQSALSKRIKALEEELDCKLIVRGARGTTPTRKGKELFLIIEETFLKLKGFNHGNIARTHSGQKRHIKVATTHAVAAYILDEILVEYTQLHPEIFLEVVTHEQLIDIIVDEIDIAIRPYEEEKKGVEQQHVFTLTKKLYASELYLQRYGIPNNTEDLIDHHIISHSYPNQYPYSNLSWILKIGMPVGEIRDPVFTTTSLENAITAARNGLGIIASYNLMSIVRNSELVNILPEIQDNPTNWCLFHPSSLNKDNDIRQIKDFITGKFLTT